MAVDLVLKALVVVTGFVIAVFGGTPVVKALLERIDPNEPAPAPATPPPPSEATDPDAVPGIVAAGRQLSGGKWIGLLERAALYASVLCGFPEGIAITLAVKSIGRYPELRTMTGRTGELFIIGTFASMLWAAALAGLAYGVVRLW